MASRLAKFITAEFLKTHPLPAYVELAHRHLEKGSPAPAWTGKSYAGIETIAFHTPADLTALTMGKELADGIETIELVFRKK